MPDIQSIDQTAALRLQLAAIIGSEPSSSYVEVRPLHRDGRPALRVRQFVPVADAPHRVPAMMNALAPAMNVFLGVCPRVREDGTASAVERCWTLWCDLDGPEALRKLAAFRPLPSIVIRTGSDGCAHVYWPLRRATSPEWAKIANRRLARHLDGDMHATDVARVLRPAGSLNHKFDPPRPAVCTRLDLNTFEIADVVRGLPDDLPPAQAQAPRRPAPGDPGSRLAGLTRTIERAAVGNRNCSLHWGACRAAEYAAAGELDAADAHAALRAAALTVGLGEPEIDATLRSASASVRATA